jgi:hypothetical protein
MTKRLRSTIGPLLAALLWLSAGVSACSKSTGSTQGSDGATGGKPGTGGMATGGAAGGAGGSVGTGGTGGAPGMGGAGGGAFARCQACVNADTTGRCACDATCISCSLNRTVQCTNMLDPFMLRTQCQCIMSLCPNDCPVSCM